MGSIADISEVLLDLGLEASVTDAERAVANAAIVRAEGAVKRHIRYDPVRRTRTEFYPQRDLSSTSREAIWEVTDVEAYLRRLSEAATDELQVRHLPIRSVTELYIDYSARAGSASGAFGSDTLKTEGTDFWPNYDMLDGDGDKVCSDGILRSFGRWPTEAGSVKIVYVAGYTAAELHGQDASIDASPIMDAVIEEAVRRAKKVFVSKKQTAGWVAGQLSGERLGDYSYTVDGASLNRQFSSMSDLVSSSKEKLAEFVNWGYSLGG